ncbi:MAG: HDIG domain-containing protein [Bacteroidales bacterium]
MDGGLTKKSKIINILLLVATIVVITLFLPHKSEFKYEYTQGKPWVYSLLTAPFDIPINLDSLSLAKERENIECNFVNIYKPVEDYTNSNLRLVREGLNRVPLITASDKQFIANRFRQIYKEGIVDNETYAKISAGELKAIRMINSNETTSIPTTGMKSSKVAYTLIDSIISTQENAHLYDIFNVAEYVSPNIVVDTLLSNRLKQEEYQRALAPIGIMQKGERIIDRGEVVTAATYTLLNTYQQIVLEKSKENKESDYKYIGQILILTILLSSLFYFLYKYRWKFFGDIRKMLFLMLLIVSFSILSFVTISLFSYTIYIIPFATVPIIIAIFFDTRTAIYGHLVLVLICCMIAPFPFEFITLQFITGLIATSMVNDLSKRSQLIECAIYIFISYCVIYTSFEVFQNGSLRNLDYQIYLDFLINAILLSFSYTLIFVFERIFGFISTVTLVELSDVNNKVLRELSEKCPGTFQHSLQVSNLATEAARRLHANVQLARTGALYHDIGKMENPAFFTENQHGGVNPHTHISPESSAEIIIKHISAGVRIAEKNKIPSVIIDFIKQHHGLGTAKYFYTTACNNSADGVVDSAPYMYPGPNPDSKETSILMMADSVEAASRSLKQYTDESITELVNRVIDSQIKDNLLKDSPLSFREIETVKQAFIDRLKTIYHTRISYPELKNKS